MTEEPYRWLEAIENRREYVEDQLRSGTPVLARSLAEGIVMAGVGTGQSKVFEIFDRHLGGAFGHPSDVERLRQAAIDTAHIEAFTRAPEDVSLRRLVGFGLSPMIKAQFEQLYSAPILTEWLLAELGASPENDTLMRLHFHGGYHACEHGVGIAAPDPEMERAAETWLRSIANEQTSLAGAVEGLLQAWWILTAKKSFGNEIPPESERKAGWREAARGKVLEIALLDRGGAHPARVRWLSAGELGL